ncbi:Eukaryotic translation initiation factor 2 subunit 2 [Nymphon striatum]|nr:Eukaryotic translation initiation factor 2 subunit 2 [Nymphon striatum]
MSSHLAFFIQIFDPSMKKKKKKKKTPFEPSALGTEVKDTEETKAEDVKETEDKENKDDDVLGMDLDDFSSSKKKKKKKKVYSPEDADAPAEKEDGNQEDGEINEKQDIDELGDDDFDFNLPKKKKKKKKIKGLTEATAEEEEDDMGEDDMSNGTGKSNSWIGTDRDYTYDELLTHVFDIMREKNPDMVAGEKRKFVMRPPQVVRVGTKKTSFANFTEICRMLHRMQKHLLQFLLAELGTSGSVDGNNQLIIKGRFQQKQIENVLKRYIKEYVTCHTCRSPDTILQKDTRLFFLQCETCGSRCSVASIKSGFQAVTSKRAAIRAKTA